MRGTYSPTLSLETIASGVTPELAVGTVEWSIHEIQGTTLCPVVAAERTIDSYAFKKSRGGGL
jgi:hypothetical protein